MEFGFGGDWFISIFTFITGSDTKWVALIPLCIDYFVFCNKFFHPIVMKYKKTNLPSFLKSENFVFLFKSSRCLFYGKGNGWFEFVMFDSFEMFAQFSRWSLSFISDGNNIQVPSIFCGSMTPTFILIDLCSPGLRVILQANIIYKHYFASVLVFWYFSQKKW